MQKYFNRKLRTPTFSSVCEQYYHNQQEEEEEEETDAGQLLDEMLFMNMASVNVLKCFDDRNKSQLHYSISILTTLMETELCDVQPQPHGLCCLQRKTVLCHCHNLT